MRGFTPGYTCWTHHGEHSVGDIGATIEGHTDTHKEYGHSVHTQEADSCFDDEKTHDGPADHLDDLVNDVIAAGNFSEDQASRLREILLRERETPLYPGSSG